MQGLAVRLGEVVLDLRAANNDWDNRSVTGVSFGQIEAAMEDVGDRILRIRDDIGVIEPPMQSGFPVEHQNAVIAVDQMADAAGDSLVGLRAPDTGELRQAALAEFLAAYERFNGAYDRVIEIVGVGADVSSATSATTITITDEATTTTTDGPTTSTTAPTASAQASGSSQDSPGTRLAIEVLEELVVASERRSGYDRDLFAHWSDLDNDGCDTRREVLIRDSRVESVLDPNRTCWVVAGLWYSYYDEEWVEGPSSLDIDHLVPLAEAWDSGAYSWTPERREAFANDEGALVAVTARSNRAKGADDPAEWMPPNDEVTCPYVSVWVATKARWGLSVDQRESAFLRGILAGECAGTTLNIRMPVLGFPDLDAPVLGTPTLDTPTLSTTGTSTDGSSTEAPPNPGNTKNCGDFSTQAEAQEWFDTYFPHYGDVARLDRNGDGRACESLP